MSRTCHARGPGRRAGVWLALLGLAACTGEAEGPVTAAGGAAATAKFAPPAAPHTVVVWATQSLRRPFELLAKRYEQDAPGAKVELWCAGGAELLDKRNGGGICDVIAIGDNSLMSRFAAAAHLASQSPTELARNRLAIITASNNPHGIAQLTDLARPGLRLALGKKSSSVGRYARWALSRAEVEVKPAAELDTADAVLAAVHGGSADAGIVYTTTCLGHENEVARIDVPEASNQPVLYSISVDRLAREPTGAAAFRALALSPSGQNILHECGFLPIGTK